MLRISPAKHVAVGWPGLLGLMFLRLFLLTGLLAILAILLPSDSVAFYAFMAFAYIVSIPYALWLRNREKVAQFVPLQFVVDLVIVTGVVYFTGGIDSDLALLYPLVILSAAIVTTPRHAIEITVLSIAVYVTVVVLMMQGVLVNYGPPLNYENWGTATRTLIMRASVFVCFGLVSAYVSQRCQYTTLELRRFREMTEIFFRNVRAGLMLLDHGNRILVVNERACRLLEQNEQQLVGRTLSELIAARPSSEGTQSELSPATCYFRRPNGESFPASVETATLTLPGEVVPGVTQPGNADVSIMVFSDISRILEMQEQVKRAERVRAAVHMAAEIAHEIRNPLAAVSGAAQQLRLLERKAAAGDVKSAEMLRKEGATFCEIIFNESVRLDHICERFIDYTEFNPEAVSVRLTFEGTDDKAKAAGHQPE